MTTHIFTEAIDLSEATLDTDNRVLRGAVLISAGESANKREYPAAVLQAAVSVFDGVKAYADHPSRTDMKERAERSIRDVTGWYDNVRFENNRLMADRHFAPTQAGNDAWALAEMVASGKAPRSLAGLSINAVGTASKREDGGMVVESITHANSVDDVTTPAAGGSYIESVNGDTLAQAFFESISYDEWLTIRSEYTERYQQEHRKVRWNAAVKEAKAEADKYAQRVQTLEAELAEVQEARATAEAKADAADRAVLIERVLGGVKIPASWKNDLRNDLHEAAEVDEFEAIVQKTISKAKAAGHKPRVPVNVPGVQIAPNPTVSVVEDLSPRDDENPAQYAARVQAAQQKR